MDWEEAVRSDLWCPLDEVVESACSPESQEVAQLEPAGPTPHEMVQSARGSAPPAPPQLVMPSEQSQLLQCAAIWAGDQGSLPPAEAVQFWPDGASEPAKGAAPRACAKPLQGAGSVQSPHHGSA